MNSMVYISIQPTTTTTTTMTTTIVPKSFKTHSPTWTTTTTTQPNAYTRHDLHFNNSINDTQHLKLSSIAYNRHIQLHQQPCYYRQPNLTNQVIKHRNSLQIQGYSPRRVHLLAMASSKKWATRLRRARGELGASRTGSSRPF